MTVIEWLNQSKNTLVGASVATARLDCLVLLEDEMGKHRGWLLAHQSDILQIEQLKRLNTKITQRAKHVPLAYIRGRVEFYGREFTITEHTLVPRPETEAMIELVKILAAKRLKKTPGPVWHGTNIHIADIGTGSGAIAITTKLELPGTDVVAVDIDPLCIEVTERNAQKLGATLQTMQGDLLEPLFSMEPAVDILLCNLPYVPDNYQINTAATHEPRHAIFGGPDGLDLYRKLFGQLSGLSAQPHYILTESLPNQHTELSSIAKAAGFALTKTDDFIQVFAPA